MKTIVELLNENGYKNANTKRERVVRNLNLLLESGIMELHFIPAETYNAKEKGRSFWMTCSDGKKRPTAYKVTLYGKDYYGHIMLKSCTTKYKSVEYMDGTCEWATNVTYYDNWSIDLQEIQVRVAQLLTIIRNSEDFFAPKIYAAKGDCSCGKCFGVGMIPAFSHYANGVCFDCGGSGIDRRTLRMYIKEAMKK